MLYATDHASFDMVPPFIGAILGRPGDKDFAAPFTPGFTQYSWVTAKMYCRNRVPGWAEQEIEDLSRSVRIFKRNVFKYFRSSLVSGIGTNNWLRLDLLVYDIPHSEEIDNFDGRQQWNALKCFEDGYYPTSKRGEHAMSSTPWKREDTNPSRYRSTTAYQLTCSSSRKAYCLSWMHRFQARQSRMTQYF